MSFHNIWLKTLGIIKQTQEDSDRERKEGRMAGGFETLKQWHDGKFSGLVLPFMP